MVTIKAHLEDITGIVTHPKGITDHQNIVTEDLKDREHHPLVIEIVKEEMQASKETITKEMIMIAEISVIRREIEIIGENILEKITNTLINAHHIDQGNKIRKCLRKSLVEMIRMSEITKSEIDATMMILEIIRRARRKTFDLIVLLHRMKKNLRILLVRLNYLCDYWFRH